MKREEMITENLAIGLLETDKKLVYGLLNTANYDVMGYVFVAGDTPECLYEVGCWEEDIEKADMMKVGETMVAEWTADRAIIIVKMKDERFEAR